MPTLVLAGNARKWKKGLDGVLIPLRDLPLKTLDFGFSEPHVLSFASFWVRNNGDAPLTVTGVGTSNQGICQVTPTNVFPVIVPPGGENEISCQFLGIPIPGYSSGTQLSVMSDDPLQPSTGAVFLVTGKTAGSHLTLPIEFELGFIMVKLPDPTSVTFHSDGSTPVILNKITLESDQNFRLNTVPEVPVDDKTPLQPGMDLIVTITPTTTEAGKYNRLMMVVDGVPLEVQIRSE